MAIESRGERRVLITGGGRGLGGAIARHLASGGMTVGVLARTASDLDSTVRAIAESGGRALALPCDLLDRDRLEQSIDRFGTWAGGLDALICASGGLRAIGPLRSLDLDTLRDEFEAAVFGVIQTIRVALPMLSNSGRASISVLVGPGHNQQLPNASGYSASQAALVRLVESLRYELAPENVFLYAVNPGIVPTPMMGRLIDTPEGRRWLPQFNEAFAEGKEVSPDVAARMIAWLIEKRPAELNGRVVSSLADPDFLETRLGRIVAEDLSILRLR